jgi:transposase-like protein
VKRIGFAVDSTGKCNAVSRCAVGGRARPGKALLTPEGLLHRGVARRAGSARRSRHVWRWVQRYAPEVNRRLRSRLQPTNDSWQVDETYIRVKGKWVYLYRAVDSSGATIDFLLSAKRDAAAAQRFLAKALGGENHPAPRVINTDKHAAYPPAIAGAPSRRRSGRQLPTPPRAVSQ